MRCFRCIPSVHLARIRGSFSSAPQAGFMNKLICCPRNAHFVNMLEFIICGCGALMAPEVSELKAIRTIGEWMQEGLCWINMHHWRLRVSTIIGMVDFFKRVLRRGDTSCLKSCWPAAEVWTDCGNWHAEASLSLWSPGIGMCEITVMTHLNSGTSGPSFLPAGCTAVAVWAARWSCGIRCAGMSVAEAPRFVPMQGAFAGA